MFMMLFNLSIFTTFKNYRVPSFMLSYWITSNIITPEINNNFYKSQRVYKAEKIN